MARKLKGIRKLPSGNWQVYARIKGHFYSDTFPAGTPLHELREQLEKWQEQYGGEDHAAGSFAADIETYLKRPGVHRMPTLNQRTAHLNLWAAALGGDRSRRSITTDEISAVLDGWLDDGLDPETVRKRRTSLRSFFSTEDPRRLNPVKAAVNPKPKKPEHREIPYTSIEAALLLMPTYRDVKKGQPPIKSLAKVRARVMAYTGIPPGMLAKVKPTDLVLDADAPSVYLEARRKGGGIEGRVVPLMPDGLAAFREFHSCDA